MVQITHYELSVTLNGDRVITYSFKAVFTYDVTRSELNYHFGSRNRPPCISIAAKRFTSAEDVYTAYLNHVEYDRRCSNASDLQRGQYGTAVMLAACIKLFKNVCPNLHTLFLDDASSISCTNPDDESDVVDANLMDLKLLTQERTWYQVILYPLSLRWPDDERRLSESIRVLRGPLTLTVEAVLERVNSISSLQTSNFWTPQRAEHMATILRQGKTSGKTLSAIMKDLYLDGQLGCYFLAHALPTLFTIFGLQTLNFTQWKLPIEDYEALNVAYNQIAITDFTRVQPPAPFQRQNLLAQGGGPFRRSKNMYLGLLSGNNDEEI